jgi:hypothetical protein
MKKQTKEKNTSAPTSVPPATTKEIKISKRNDGGYIWIF